MDDPGEPEGISVPLLLPAPSQRAGLLGQLTAVAIALLGGAFGVFGAFVQEAQTGGLLLLPFLGAPIVEELVKPSGVYLLLARWPRLLRGRLHTALLSAVAGLSFGVVEAVVYVTLYVRDPPAWFVTYRFTVPLFLHATASFIVGLGINRGLLDWARRGSPLPKATRNFYLAGIGLHAAFNTVATALLLAGVFDDV
ncbi:MAG: PrsW family glutamic-type intramembrane protease [Dehalococcoidia bacterium]|nr:PrsW family glutamic-type intramembrane protease [Dehalococcoidia bacterium]